MPNVLQAVVESGRRDPVRSWYAAVGVLAVVFVVVTSVGVISGRSLHNSGPIMVQPPGPAVPTPGGAALTVPDGTRRDLAARGESGQTSTAPRTTAPTTSPSPSTPPRARTTPPTARPSTSTPAAPPPATPTSRPPASSPPAPPPPGGGNLTARYTIFSSWQDGFTTGIVLVNGTDKPQTWKLKLVHERSDGVRVKELWNATLKQGGATTNVFTGGTLAPGATLTFGFNASKNVSGEVHPTSCKINNHACTFG